ncbi:hypothetical protein YC2023_028292 [Brassica napus]
MKNCHSNNPKELRVNRNGLTPRTGASSSEPHNVWLVRYSSLGLHALLCFSCRGSYEFPVATAIGNREWSSSSRKPINATETQEPIFT